MKVNKSMQIRNNFNGLRAAHWILSYSSSRRAKQAVLVLYPCCASSSCCMCVCMCVHSAHSWRLIESQLPLQGQCCVLCALCKSRGHCGAVFVLSNAKYASVKWWARQQKEERETPYIVSFSIFKSPVIFLSLSLSWLWEVLQSLTRYCLSLSLLPSHSVVFLR